MIRALGERWNRFWFEPTSADNLGLCRIILYGSMFLFYLLSPALFRSWGWHADFTPWGNVSSVFWTPVWLFRVLHLPQLSTTSLIAVQTVWRLALFTSFVGLLTRFSTAVSFIFGAYLFGLPNNFGRIHHLDQLVLWAFLVMAFSRCGDAWSLDALIRKARAKTAGAEKEPAPSGEYTWPVHLIWVISAVVYLEAGISKLRHSGIEWVTTETMQNFLTHAYYHVSDSEPLTSWGQFFAQSHWLSSALAAGSLLLEVGFVFALFSRRARPILVPGVVSMQIGIALFMGPNFYQMIMCQSLWVPWDRVVRSIAARFSAREPYALAFDGSCGLCRRTIAILRSLDVLRRVKFLDAAHYWPEIEKQFPDLDRERCHAEMHLRTPEGKIRTGFYAYRALAWVLPLGWLAVPFLYLPGMAWIGSHIYSDVASRRHGSACAIPELTPDVESKLASVPKLPHPR
jgi:predicted DCC family thiol-disulfide oxidoreductase YuxK